jgi:two-component system cell cycle sensor histidine kinase/response regulator CckA
MDPVGGVRTDDWIARLEFYEQLVDHLPIAIAVLSPLGIFEFINATGIPDSVQRHRMTGRPFGDLSPVYVRDPAVIAERDRHFARAMKEGERIEFEERLTLISGAHQHLRHTLVPMRDARGVITRVMAAAVDRTAQHDAEEQLRHAQKMEVAGRLAGGVAHDFNNLLTVIRGISDLLRDEMQAHPDAVTMLEELQLAVRRGHDLTRQLLAFSRPGDGEVQAFLVDDAVRSTTRLVRRLLPDRIQLQIATACKTAWVRMDPGALDQVLLNLAANARDAISGDGVLEIRTQLREREIPSSTGTPTGKRHFVHLTVTDSGQGMPESVRQRVFEPFFTTKKIGAGTGLGLATVRTLIEQAGGWVAVDSLPQLGTTMHCWLPTVDPPNEAPTTVGVEAQPPQPVARRILLVEDEDGVRRVVHRLLTRAGYEVEEARVGQEALALVGDDIQRFDLVLTDVYMPGMNGVLLAEWLRTQRHDLPILFMSGHIDDPQLVERLRTSDAVVVDKPFTAEALLAHIQRLIPATDA